MKQPDDVKRELVRQWLSKAREDLATARYLVADRIQLGFAIGVHAQQAVEKCVKAVLVWHQIEFPKTQTSNGSASCCAAPTRASANSFAEPSSSRSTPSTRGIPATCLFRLPSRPATQCRLLNAFARR